MNKLKYCIICCLAGIISTACTNSEIIGMPNPWINCGQSTECASNKAGFQFPINIADCNIRAMEDMIEVEFPFNQKSIIIRKSKQNKGDISGNYNNYPVNKELEINSAKFDIRGNDDNSEIFVVNFSSKKANYAILCSDGLSLNEIWSVYELIKKADNF